MSDFAKAISEHADLSIEAQIAAGKPLGDSMPAEHIAYLAALSKLVDDKVVTVGQPESFLHRELYAQADEPMQGKIDLVLPTMADIVRHILAFYRDPSTPNACPQLKTMIEHLWQMLRRLGPSASLLQLPPPPAL